MSALFSTSTCNFGTDTIVNSVVWNNVDQIAAMSSNTMDENDNETNNVHFMNNEGVLIVDCLISHLFPASTFEWQPNSKILAIGWSDGLVSTWNIDVQQIPAATLISSNNSEHNTAITVLKWNPAGKRLITGDKMGQIIVWNIDNSGHIIASRQYRKKGEITTAVFCALPSKGKTINPQSRRTEAIKNLYSPPFFFGTDKGTISYADDLGHCTDIQSLASSVDTMLFFDDLLRLLVITRSLMLTQYQVTLGGKVTRLNQVKLSASGDILELGIRNCVWASPGLVATATHEKMVRLYDVAADEAYNLPLSAIPASEGVDTRNDKIVTVDFGPLDRSLAVGTRNGLVAIWKYTGMIRDLCAETGVVPTTVSDWEFQYWTNLGSPVLEVTWSKGQSSLSVVTDESVHVLNECVIYTALNGPLTIIQQNNSDVCILYQPNSNSRIVTNSNKLSDDDIKSESKYDEYKYNEYDGRQDSHNWLINTEIFIKGIATGKSCFAIWNGSVAQIYRVIPQDNRIEQVHVMSTSSVAIAVVDTIDATEESIFVCDNNSVVVYNFSGVVKANILYTDSEGNPEHISINGKFMAVVTSKGIIKFYDIQAPTKPKLLGLAAKFYNPLNNMEIGQSGYTPSSTVVSTASSAEGGDSALLTERTFLNVKSIKVNCDGTRVAMLVHTVEGALQIRHPHSNLYVYDRLKGSMNHYSFSSVNQSYAAAIAWDEIDDRILCAEVRHNKLMELAPQAKNHGDALKGLASDNKAELNESFKLNQNLQQATTNDNSETAQITNGNNTQIFIFFVTTENGILLQDSFVKTKSNQDGPFIGISVPNIYFKNNDLNLIQRDSSKSEINLYDSMTCVVMRDFANMGTVNQDTKLALLDFSYNLTLGKLDEAYRCVKSINNPVLWENMAQMCVNTKRIDVAEICLSQMGHARGAAALREAKKDGGGNLEVSVGVLAVQLGFYDEAVELFREAKRFDLINNLLQASGKYEKAVKVSQQFDRMHSSTTHYQYAKHLESIGDIEEAIVQYELSSTANSEVPRMLFKLDMIDRLERYIHSKDDPVLWKWWAAYMEKNGRQDKAYKFYRKAADFVSCVRIACSQEDLTQASELVQECGDKAASYTFARHLESKGEFESAIAFYAASDCLTHSIRLAMEHGLDTDLLAHALKSTPNLNLDCAEYFERKGNLQKAIELYNKGGNTPYALELCFRMDEFTSLPGAGYGNQSTSKSSVEVFEMINSIAANLDTKTSPKVLQRCAEFLIGHKQFERAMELYVIAKKFAEAIEVCAKYKITITESSLGRLVPDEGGAGIDAVQRKEILSLLAATLRDQGSYALASKIYTQIGDRVQAIKCLVMSGETKAVIQFASISRNNEIYILAANYLQQMNWRESMEIMKAIITFYTKAKAVEQLAGFFESCAQVEVDEYRDYDKALGAYQEAVKHLSQSTSKRAVDMKAMIESRVQLINKFIQARNIEKENPDSMVATCENLLKDPQLDSAVRVGDCLALLVEHFYDSGNSQRALQYLEEMKRRMVPLNTYIDSEILDDIYQREAGGTCGSEEGKTEDTKGMQHRPAMGGNAGINTRLRTQSDEEDIGDESVAANEEIDEEIDMEESYKSKRK